MGSETGQAGGNRAVVLRGACHSRAAQFSTDLRFDRTGYSRALATKQPVPESQAIEQLLVQAIEGAWLGLERHALSNLAACQSKKAYRGRPELSRRTRAILFPVPLQVMIKKNIPAGSVLSTASLRRASSVCVRALTKVFCCRPLTRCFGTAAASGNCSPLIRFWKFSNRHPSANTATTVFRCLPGIGLWRESISKPIGKPKAQCAVSPARRSESDWNLRRGLKAREAVRTALDRFAGALKLKLCNTGKKHRLREINLNEAISNRISFHRFRRLHRLNEV